MQRLILALLSGVALWASFGASAQSHYPSKLVTVVNSGGPGSVRDVVARTLAQKLSLRFNSQFIVENRGGAGGGLGTAYVAKAPPDGHTLLFSTEAPLVINPHIYKSVNYDPIKDLAPITQVGFQSFYVVMCPKLAITSLSDLASYGSKKQLTYASVGFGTTMHLAGEMLSQKLNIRMTHLPYKGVSPAIADIISCNVDIGFIAISTAAPLIEGGQAKALAVSTPTRWSATPEIPTLRELGFKDLELIESSFSLLAPANTPRDIINLLQFEAVKIMSDDEMAKKLNGLGMRLVNGTADEFAAWIVDANERYKTIIKAANIEKLP